MKFRTSSTEHTECHASRQACRSIRPDTFSTKICQSSGTATSWKRKTKKFEGEVSRLNTAKNKALLAVHELVYQKIQDDVGHNLSRTAAEKIFNYAYDDKHAYGFHEVRWELERLVELVSEILAEQKKPQWNKKDGKK